MSMHELTFDTVLSDRPTPKGVDVICDLQHFAIITYSIDPAKLMEHIPDRFLLDTVVIDGQEKALLSVVPFIDVNFTSAAYLCPKFTMGQTNYRIYIIDQQTGERGVWFLGTTLDSWTLAVPRNVWNLPWHKGKISFDCHYDSDKGCYTQYEMETVAEWAPAHVSLSQSVSDKMCLPGFSSVESGLVYLTHPLVGFYHRRDGRLGSYRVWHDVLAVKPAKLQHAYFGLLSRLGLLNDHEQQHAHSVLVEPVNQFTIYLPPSVIE